MSQTLAHRGYEGSVQFSAEDKLLYGKIIGIRDSVSYEGTTVDLLESNFREAVEDYLAFCNEVGKTPEPASVATETVDVPSPLYSRMSRFAEEHQVPLRNVVEQALSNFLEHAE